MMAQKSDEVRKYFIAAKGHSMEAKAYEEAFNSVLADLKQ